MERETADHFLLRCSRYSEARSVMKNYIYEMWFTDNKKRQSKLYGSILLAPAWDSGVTKKADREIKNALFQFLKTVKRKFSLSIILQYSHNCLIYWCVVLLWCYSLCSKIYLQSYKCLQMFDSIWAPLATTLTTDYYLGLLRSPEVNRPTGVCNLTRQGRLQKTTTTSSARSCM